MLNGDYVHDVELLSARVKALETECTRRAAEQAEQRETYQRDRQVWADKKKAWAAHEERLKAEREQLRADRNAAYLKLDELEAKFGRLP